MARESKEEKLIRMTQIEREITFSHPSKHIAGIDEVGRGPLAGPVCAAAVILPAHLELPGLTDSKKLSDKKRRELYPLIKEQAIAYGIGFASEKEIDEYVDKGLADGKAGAYGIQDQGALFVERIEGDYYNIVGLPIARLNREIRSLLEEEK